MSDAAFGGDGDYPARPGGGVMLHVREVAGQPVTLDPPNVKTWEAIEDAAEVNALGVPLQQGIEALEMKPCDVRFIHLRFASTRWVGP